MHFSLHGVSKIVMWVNCYPLTSMGTILLYLIFCNFSAQESEFFQKVMFSRILLFAVQVLPRYTVHHNLPWQEIIEWSSNVKLFTISRFSKYSRISKSFKCTFWWLLRWICLDGLLLLNRYQEVRQLFGSFDGQCFQGLGFCLYLGIVIGDNCSANLIWRRPSVFISPSSTGNNWVGKSIHHAESIIGAFQVSIYFPLHSITCSDSCNEEVSIAWTRPGTPNPHHLCIVSEYKP